MRSRCSTQPKVFEERAYQVCADTYERLFLSFQTLIMPMQPYTTVEYVWRNSDYIEGPLRILGDHQLAQTEDRLDGQFRRGFNLMNLVIILRLSIFMGAYFREDIEVH